jgi:predicted RNase H-like HicB family nuclease
VNVDLHGARIDQVQFLPAGPAERRRDLRPPNDRRYSRPIFFNAAPNLRIRAHTVEPVVEGRRFGRRGRGPLEEGLRYQEKPVFLSLATVLTRARYNALRHEGFQMNELVFDVTQEADGGFVAECLTEAIFTQADTWEELRANAREAVRAFFGDAQRPASIRLHLVRDEVLASG